MDIKFGAFIASAPIEHDGKTNTLKEWCYLYDLDYSVVRMRYTRGMRGEDLFAKTPRSFGHLEKTFVLSDSIFRRLEHHGKRLHIMPTKLMQEIVKHGLSKLDSNESQQPQKENDNA
jgi:hypothetical protein